MESPAGLSLFLKFFCSNKKNESPPTPHEQSQLAAKKEVVSRFADHVVELLDLLDSRDRHLLEEAFLYELMGLLVRLQPHILSVRRLREAECFESDLESSTAAARRTRADLLKLLKDFAGADHEDARDLAAQMLTGGCRLFDIV